MKDVVFDSHAILKFAQDEAGANRVEELLTASQDGRIRAFMNEINLGEIYYITIRRLGIESAKEFLEHFYSLPIELAPASWDIIASASELKARYALSYADCFAMASALKHDASVVTGDPEFKNVEHVVEVDWI
ncbi:MAG: type II toxin-antitoxin system VapC family toxin [Syntrophobacteraceae bacterium]